VQNFFDDSSSLNESGIEDVLFDDNVEQMIVLLIVKDLKDRRKKPQ
jgi:hypothetical protein